MEKACHDPRLMKKLGDNIQQGPWWESSLRIDHEGHSAAFHIPIIGTRGHARMHLRAVRYEGAWPQFNFKTGSTLWEIGVNHTKSQHHSLHNIIQCMCGVLFHYERAKDSWTILCWCFPLLNSRFSCDSRLIWDKLQRTLSWTHINELINWVMSRGKQSRMLKVAQGRENSEDGLDTDASQFQ